MKKKILIFHPTVAPYRIDLFNFLTSVFDAKVCLFLRNLKSQVFDYSKIEKQLKFVPQFIVKKELGFIKWCLSMWKELCRENYDIIIVHEFGISTIITVIHRFITRGKYKIVSITDDSYNMIADGNHFTRRHKKAIGILTPCIDDVINVEPKVTEWYQEHYKKGIYFPIICDDKKAVERQYRILPISDSYVEKYHLINKKILLFVGRLVKIKNMQFAIDAFLKANIPDSVFIVVGSGEEGENLKERYKGCENVKIIGRFESDELYAWYNVAQIFTLPSIKEPFGAVTNEALVAGCQVLISKDAGSNCLVEEGVNGYVIDPYDENDYIEKLQKLMAGVAPIKQVYVKENLMQETFESYSMKLINRLNSI